MLTLPTDLEVPIIQVNIDNIGIEPNIYALWTIPERSGVTTTDGVSGRQVPTTCMTYFSELLPLSTPPYLANQETLS